MQDGERMITHYVGDACPGGHREESKQPPEGLITACSYPSKVEYSMTEPIDLEAALRAARERVEHESVVRIREALRVGDDGPMEHTWPWPAFDAALDQYEALARAVGAAEHALPTTRMAVRKEAERLAREVLNGR